VIVGGFDCLGAFRAEVDSVVFVYHLTGHTEELKLEVVSHLPTYAIVRWTNFFLNDHRELLSWVINLREA